MQRTHLGLKQAERQATIEKAIGSKAIQKAADPRPLFLQQRTAIFQENRPVVPRVPPSRPMGHSIWRRYPNGCLDFSTSKWRVFEAWGKLRAFDQINEHDALVLQSVWPAFRFQGITDSLIHIKANLAASEREVLQGLCAEMKAEIEEFLGIVDAGEKF